MSHPLDEILGTQEQKVIDGDYGVEIPEDPEAKNLQLIIDLALKSYKEQMDDIALLEPKYRSAAFKVALDYLTQAKDAKYKLDKLAMDREKMTRKPSTSSSEKSSEEDDAKGSGDEGLSRKALQERLRRVK